MTTRTRTATSHYEVQKKRRADEMEFWRQNRLNLVRGAEVVMHPTPRGIDRGVLVGMDGDRPSLVLDAHRHEIAPGTASTVHRHSWDAIMFVTAGRGWTEVDGRRYDWRAWDTVYLPAWAWHRHGNEGDSPATYVTFGSEPLAELVGMAIIEGRWRNALPRTSSGAFGYFPRDGLGSLHTAHPAPGASSAGLCRDTDYDRL